MILISYILPVYKVENVLHRCLDSLYAQDLKEDEFEIVAVDDGSPDHSGDVCREYQKQHSNIKYIHQENQGQGAARNRGIEMAEGKYITFVDSDDFLVAHTFKSILDMAEKTEAELCFFRAIYSPSTGKILNSQPFRIGKVYTGEYILLHGMLVSSACWSIYRSDFLKKSGVRFVPNVFSEDVCFNFSLYPLANKVVFTDILAYIYTRDAESSTHTRNKQKLRKVLLDTVIVNKHILDFSKSNNFTSNIISLYMRRINSNTASFLLNLLHTQNNYDNNIITDYLKLSIENGFYPIKGKTLSSRLDLFVPFINCRWLYLLVAKLLKELCFLDKSLHFLLRTIKKHLFIR